jgi:hypothetical protein
VAAAGVCVNEGLLGVNEAKEEAETTLLQVVKEEMAI